MSRIGKKNIIVPANVTVAINDRVFSAKGPLGEEKVSLIDGINIEINNNQIAVDAKTALDDKKIASVWGLMRTLISNCVVGVSTGFEKYLDIIGVGYRATQQSKNVMFQLGFSHNITFEPPTGIAVEVMEPTKLKVKGTNKELVGQIAANIRELRPPEPYKGKGIRYKDEVVRKKAGKTGK